MTDNTIFELERPHPNLLKIYALQALMTGPGFFVLFPVLFFRYHTLKYRFDEEGISMSWGILFRHQVNLTYSRIQDIHLHAGIFHRWLGLADLKIQTASGSATAEMSIEGFLEFEEIKRFIYGKMRGLKDHKPVMEEYVVNQQMGENKQQLLQGILEELQLARKAVEKLNRNTL